MEHNIQNSQGTRTTAAISEEEDFEKLLSKSQAVQEFFEAGDRVNGRVVFISKDSIFLDISGKSEGVMEKSECLDKNGACDLKVGDVIEAFVLSTKGGEISLTKSIGKGQANGQVLEMAHRSGIPVEGLITGTHKGGYAVTVSGITCFCPFSQIDIKTPANPEELLNKRFTFKIIQYSDRGTNIVLSRRVLLEQEMKTREEELKKNLKVGDSITGTIRSIQDFGLFVDLKGADALIPKSEVSWKKNADLKGYAVGDEITAKVLSIDWDARRIALSIKALLPEPWSKIDQFKPDQTVPGQVLNMIKSGAFVEIENGIEGFVPVSRMSLVKKINKPEDVLAIGDSVQVRIISINREERKILMELVTGESDPWQTDGVDRTNDIMHAVVESANANGVTARLDDGMAGFIPVSELDIKKGADIAASYPAGKELSVVIKDLRRSERRLILSERNAEKQKEINEYRQYATAAGSDKADATMGSAFKDAFAEIKKKRVEQARGDD